ncbi:hypothetical protein [Nocardioides sp. B-3]|uniref:hypothetical protein n=1 Tax=Nocardioides sp. B-3 TaxID=2895565 RepID=UPI00215390E0|nr:hypothetical protein [Nocardioides sp. B-3]UUZ59909.1 hypothetical protein LP418_02355 [Nocardioides sp. B-3]
MLEMFGAVAEASIGRYRAGDPEGATDVIFAETIPDWRENVETASPGGLAKADWATFYETEFAGVGEWQFGPEQAAVIDCPVLSPEGRPGEPARCCRTGIPPRPLRTL